MRALGAVCACLMVAATAATQNLLTNATFNGSTNGWDVGNHSSYDSTLDATGTSGSGSVRTVMPPLSVEVVLYQCVPVVGSTVYKAGGKVLIPSGQATPGYGDFMLAFHATAGCADAEYLQAAYTGSVSSPGAWTATDTGLVSSPAGAHSAFIAFRLWSEGASGSPDFYANVDDVYLIPGGGAAYARWIPAVIHKDVPSKSAKWRSDLAILIHSSSSAHLTITIHASAGPLSKTYTMAGNTQILIPDVANWLGVTADSGPLEVTSDQEFFLSGRTYNQVDATHTYGQDYDGQEPSELLGASDSAWLPQLTENSFYRTNIGITNTGTETANVTLTLYDAAGNQVWTDARDYAPGGFYQYQQPYLPFGSIASGYAKVTVNSGSGVVAYASVVDANTGDPTTITMKR